MAAYLFPVTKTIQKLLIGFGVTFGVIPACAVFLRIWSRRLAKRRLQVATVACQGDIIAACLIGYHEEDAVNQAGPDALITFGKLIVGIEILWALGVCLTKLSILDLYSKVFPTRTMQVSVWTLEVVTTSWAITAIVFTFVICRPITKALDPTMPEDCGRELTSWKAIGIIDIATSVIILIMPFPYLTKMHTATHKRITIIVTFSLGLVTTTMGILRLIYLLRIAPNDMKYTIGHAIIFSGLESSIAVTLACVPLLRPLILHSCHHHREYYSSMYDDDNNNNNNNDEDGTTRLRPCLPLHLSRNGTDETMTTRTTTTTKTAGNNNNNKNKKDDDELELRPRGTAKYMAEISTTSRATNVVVTPDSPTMEGGHYTEGDLLPSPTTQIHIQQGWAVSSERNSSSK